MFSVARFERVLPGIVTPGSVAATPSYSEQAPSPAPLAGQGLLDSRPDAWPGFRLTPAAVAAWDRAGEGCRVQGIDLASYRT